MGNQDKSLVADWIDQMRLRGKAPRTLHEYGRGLRRLSEWLYPIPITEATEADLLRWRASLNVSNSTVHNYATPVRSFYAWLERRGHVRVNPAIDLPVPPARRGLPRPIGDADLDYAIDTAPARVRPWLVLAAYSGLRALEIAGLRRQDVLNTWHPAMLRIMGKGTKERMVPLSPYVWSELQAAGLPRRGPLFTRIRGFGPNTAKQVSKLANEHMHDCGFDETLHQLRHWFGTETLAESDGNIRVVQELMGHANIATTAVYAAIRQADAVNAVLGLQPGERSTRRPRVDL